MHCAGTEKLKWTETCERLKNNRETSLRGNITTILVYWVSRSRFAGVWFLKNSSQITLTRRMYPKEQKIIATTNVFFSFNRLVIKPTPKPCTSYKITYTYKSTITTVGNQALIILTGLRSVPNWYSKDHLLLIQCYYRTKPKLNLFLY